MKLKPVKKIPSSNRGQTNNRVVPLYVWIPREVDKELRRAIVQKYGEFRRGLLSLEVTLALRAWLGAQKTSLTQMPFRVSQRLPQYYGVWLEVKDCIEKRFNIRLESGQEYPLSLLKKAIMIVRGGDPRTIKKWINHFVELGLIELKDKDFWEFKDFSIKTKKCRFLGGKG